jgi:hypothetical protein
MLLPLLQSAGLDIPEKRLNGFFRLKPEPDLTPFNRDRWFKGEFQKEYASRLEDHVGFRNSLFRIHNQYDFSLFGITHALGFISGKKGVLFEEDYIREYTGDFFIGKRTLDIKLRRLKAVHDTLEKFHKDLVIVFEPGKASFSPEYIPGRYHPGERTLSNYEYLRNGMERLNIPYLDLNRYFLLMKDTCRYPLFPKYGMHWSLYGMNLAMDTLLKFVGKLRDAEMPSFSINRIKVTDSLQSSDNDIGNLLNLIWPLPKTQAAYPEITVTDIPDKEKLSMLVIADSYYQTVVQDFRMAPFRYQEYWFYNSKLYPRILDNDNPEYIDKSDLAGKLKQFDLVMVMSSEINLHCCFWNFADEAYLAFHPGEQDSEAYKMENRIRVQREWFRFMVEKAKKSYHSLEKVIAMDAEYMAKKQGKQ